MNRVLPIYKDKHETGFKCEFGNCESTNAVINYKGTYFCATHAYYIMTGRFLSLDLIEDERTNREKMLLCCERDEELNKSESQPNFNKEEVIHEPIQIIS